MRRVLRVTARHFCAGAVWERTPQGWRCIRAAPIIGWMTQCSATEARDRLDLMRYTWEWINADAVPDDS
jgi:hypothetical protein